MAFDLDRLAFYPELPGVYLMKDGEGRVLYVGKAKNIKARLKQYFFLHDERVQVPFLISKVVDIEAIITSSEDEALFLESVLIKKFKPKYNVIQKDDRSQLLLHIGLDHPWPGIEFLRARSVQNVSPKVFGPFIRPRFAQDIFDCVVELFSIRQCSDEAFRRRTAPCLLFQIGRCTAPCVGKVSKREYDRQVSSAIEFLSGKTASQKAKFLRQMEEASEQLHFEEAAAFHRKVQAIDAIAESQHIPKRLEDLNIVGSHGAGADGVCSDVIQYTDQSETILEALQQLLSLRRIPRIIDCFDASHFGGTNLVAASIGFVDGRKAKGRYRKFHIRGVTEGNDLEMLSEAIRRRYQKADGSEELPDLIIVDGGREHIRAAHRVIEELSFLDVELISICKDQGRHDKGLAPEKLFQRSRQEGACEAVFEEISLPKTSPELLFLQSVRDEAHRYVLQFQRTRRVREVRVSQLDEIPGVGEKKRSRLLKAFRGVGEISSASVQDIMEKAGLSQRDAERITAFFRSK